MVKGSPIPAKFSTWITMLLVWNIALLSIALFYLFNLTQHYISSEELAAECADAMNSSASTAL